MFYSTVASLCLRISQYVEIERYGQRVNVSTPYPNRDVLLKDGSKICYSPSHILHELITSDRDAH